MSATGITRIQSSMVGDGTKRTYNAVYEITTDSRDDGPQVVRAYAVTQIPPGTAYSFGNDSDAWVFSSWPKSIKLRSVEKSAKVWRVTIPYTNIPLERDDENDEDNPLDEPYKISGSFVRTNRTIFKDVNDKAIVNSADEPYLPQPTIDDSRDTIVIVGNAAAIDLGLRAEARDKVNVATLWGLEKRTIKLAAWDWEVKYYRPGVFYIQNRLEFEINTATWDLELLDAGFRTKTTDAAGDTVYQPITCEDTAMHRGKLLDKQGGELAEGEDPKFNAFQVYETYDFTQLPIPTTLVLS